MVAMLTLHLDNVPIMLFVALWAINKLAAADSALNKLDPEERKAARKLAMDCTGTPWLLPVHCMVPSAGLIAILLIIGGVEVNPGPFMSIVFTLLMLVTMPSGKRSWSEAEGPSKTDSNPVVVLMPHNPFLDKLTQTDLTGLLDTESALRDEIVNFFLGMLQLQTHSHQPKEWLMLHTFFFEKLYSSNRSLNTYGVYMPENVASWFNEAKQAPSQAKGVPWYQHRKIFVPINLKDEFHWIAAVIDLEHNIITSYDSLQNAQTERMQILAQWIAEQSALEPHAPKYKASDFQIRDAKDIPKQKNSVDCGIFVIKYAQSLVEGKRMDFSQETMPSIREQMHCSLLSMKEHIDDGSASDDASISDDDLSYGDLVDGNEDAPMQSPAGGTQADADNDEPGPSFNAASGQDEAPDLAGASYEHAPDAGTKPKPRCNGC
ncbi:hypothetical protein WJX77_000669 [Trebouxia sp. C0004]